MIIGLEFAVLDVDLILFSLLRKNKYHQKYQQFIIRTIHTTRMNELIDVMLSLQFLGFELLTHAWIQTDGPTHPMGLEACYLEHSKLFHFRHLQTAVKGFVPNPAPPRHQMIQIRTMNALTPQPLAVVSLWGVSKFWHTQAFERVAFETQSFGDVLNIRGTI